MPFGKKLWVRGCCDFVLNFMFMASGENNVIRKELSVKCSIWNASIKSKNVSNVSKIWSFMWDVYTTIEGIYYSWLNSFSQCCG